MTAASVPPGRAGRVRLARRLATAQRGEEVLNSKLQILRQEQQRLALRLVRTQGEWDERCRDAQERLVQAVLVGGQRSLRAALPEALARVDLTWREEMGVRYPDTARCVLPEREPGEAGPGNAALVVAEEAFRQALEAGVRHAVARSASERVSAEVAVTRRRLRALSARVTPQLTEALSSLELVLEQTEHEDAVRLRWAAGRPGRTG